MLTKRRLMLVLVFLVVFSSQVAYCKNATDRFEKYSKTLWYGIYMQGAKIGFMTYSFEKSSGAKDGWILNTEMEMRAKMGGQEGRISTRDRRFFNNDGELSGLEMTFSSPTGEIFMNGSVLGDKFIVTTSIAGRQAQKTFARPADTLDNQFIIESYITSGKCNVGDRYLMNVLDATPPEPKKMTEEVIIAGRKEGVLKGIPTSIYTVEALHPEFDLKSTLKYDASGNLLEGSPGTGVIVKLQAEQEAKDISNNFDIMENGLVVPKGEIADVGSAERLAFKISGIDKSDILCTASQKIIAKNGALEAVIFRQSEPDRPMFLPINSEQVKAYLLPTAFEQSDDPELIDLANKIAGQEKNSWEAAKKINGWVYKNIQKVFTPDMSNARQTLHSGKGDCGEHTALAVALLRAAGIPARSVTGLVYWPAGKAMGYHAWTEVFVGKWVQMDPALGEDLADPSHIALAYDSSRKAIGILARIMGNIKIEVLQMH